MKKYTEPLKAILDRLHLSIRKNNLKNSKQREFILKALYEDGGHLSPEDIFGIIRKTCASASVSSIYRILSFLEKEGFISSIEVDRSGKRYEIASGLHHDHIICVECGKIEEFCNHEIEKLQIEVTNSYNAKPVSHDMLLYVVCEKCLKKSDKQTLQQ
ncbi:Fur family transcriptional regulator [Helicobacter sp. MIT 05-5294]|uniref:ferric iron uptake transcriptional regulator n=1 Tax=Helicobacter sp. MIT 05-5294 TaxID=1548150 RepID=UPI00051FC3A3|nr:Fur family transcriptional regulator [Helicobacter sp. MIT 05-5294]TLD87815.1 transcriptional repressor [Helicobacter sp. MIT 05-5294]